MNWRASWKIVLLSCALGFTSTVVFADDWAGFYVGIDSLDGSIDHLSISPNEDGTYDIRSRPSKISHCKTDHGSGVIVATGKVVNEQLLRQNVQLLCHGTEVVSLPDQAYTRDDDTDILYLVSSDDGRKLVFHRISDD
ncbi:MAG TPA: hypothetical protein VKN35_08215 [Xanthomonadales bacterium]|nr:hypothetical protein [Xanthomonadales bacterium]